MLGLTGIELSALRTRSKSRGAEKRASGGRAPGQLSALAKRENLRQHPRRGLGRGYWIRARALGL
ncbi:MAG TPA: hypothetical protein ENJ18_02335 [Nannocystis exedens]|nr:hypothetical protein [Nannocystis exedens]